MGPIAHFGETEMLRKGNKEFALRARWDRSLVPVRPKCYEGKQRVYIAISVGPISHLGGTKTLQREIERLQSHLSEIEIPIGETDLLRVCGSGYDI